MRICSHAKHVINTDLNEGCGQYQQNFSEFEQKQHKQQQQQQQPNSLYFVVFSIIFRAYDARADNVSINKTSIYFTLYLTLERVVESERDTPCQESNYVEKNKKTGLSYWINVSSVTICRSH